MSQWHIVNAAGEYLRTIWCDDPKEQLSAGETALPGPPPADLVPAQPPMSAEEAEASRIVQIKAKANAAILAIAPEWKQRNLIARGLELTEILAAGGSLTSAQQAESDAIKAIWAQISAIRAASDQAEADGTPADQFNP